MEIWDDGIAEMREYCSIMKMLGGDMKGRYSGIEDGWRRYEETDERKGVILDYLDRWKELYARLEAGEIDERDYNGDMRCLYTRLETHEDALKMILGG